MIEDIKGWLTSLSLGGVLVGAVLTLGAVGLVSGVTSDGDASESASTSSPSAAPVVTTREVTETEVIPSTQTETVQDPGLLQGVQVERRPATNGVKTRIYLITTTNGVEGQKVLKSEGITTPPLNRIVAVGTKPNHATCVDVTSIDWNWDNDVRCTRPDGSVFYTDYAGGYANDPNFSR